MCCNNARPGSHHLANLLQICCKLAALRSEVSNLQLWDRVTQTLCKLAAISAKMVQRALFWAIMYKNSAWRASERYFSFIGSLMVLIYFCSTLHTAQGKSPNTFTSYNYRHFQWYFGLAALTSIAANLQLFSVYLDICSVRKHACKFCSFLSEFWGWWGPAADVQSTLSCFRKETYARSSCTVPPHKV